MIKLTHAEKIALLTPEWVHSLFRYNAELGQVIWRERPREHFKTKRAWSTWNSNYAEKRTGAKLRNWWAVNIPLPNQVGHLATYESRLVIFLTKSHWPASQIDHENHDGADNRLNNLREATAGQNSQNRRIRTDSISRVIGVRRVGRKWYARIGVKGKLIWSKPFNTVEEAIEARKQLKAKYHTFQPFDRVVA
jgi:hypothetical protein